MKNISSGLLNNKLPSNAVGKSGAGFTLLELLIVIGILAILAVAVILIFNPLEFNRQSRDSVRTQDLTAVRSALDFVAFEDKLLKNSNEPNEIVYVSIPDTDSKCANLGLPALYPGWEYRCVTEANLRKVDGTGWIPVDFTKLSTRSPLSKLPIDPVNSTSTGLYYAYITGPSFKITALFESEKLAPYMNKDGGSDPTLYEIGSTPGLNLANFHRGMVAYWNMNGNANDSSGYGSNGTENGGVTYTKGKLIQAGYFDGSSGYIDLGDPTSLQFTSSMTISAWVKLSSIPSDARQIIDRSGYDGNRGWRLIACGGCIPNNSWAISGISPDGTDASTTRRESLSPLSEDWTHIIAIYDAQARTLNMYINGMLSDGALSGIVPASQYVSTIGPDIGKRGVTTNNYFPGLIDDLRVYNRAISATEVKAIYNATK